MEISIEEAIQNLEQAQKLVQPVYENAQDLTSNEEFKNSIGTALNLLNNCAEDLADKDPISESLKV